ncbi:MAG: hypothetical protein KJ871_00290 [Alphaproteobacteria bacterium]|nr:hypothetical protein [Alphaproteobacteria bacterium]MBU2083770.1 hypothetical protein [Alphaproteobacteria bacterium]MBU2142555.1 hypothetical protein [Alphaproteobacteria bacterium]MBU2197691.1 hypothetical protein [Alphaproteobacteria bacterium]
MRVHLWSFDTVTVDLEDRDVSVKAVHALNGVQVIISFRLSENQLKGGPISLRRTIETLAADKILDLASFLDSA